MYFINARPENPKHLWKGHPVLEEMVAPLFNCTKEKLFHVPLNIRLK
ncbi:MAG: hypothetical protein J0H93_10660 [Chlamydiales bacterium]|nr:hypothetical protein [Chlamydiales bacterium]